MAASMRSSLVLAVLCAAFSMCSCFHTCISSRLHTNSLCSTAASRNSKAAYSSRRQQRVLMLQDSELESPAVSADDEFADWAETGRKGRVLKRKKDTPLPEYTPQQVCDKVLRALQLNDDPMLDYGAAVLVMFSSQDNAASQLSPSAYGRYLRTSEFEVLLENSRFGLKGDLK
eukprot:20326-Heterococcus_DN1.PRE.1